MKNFITLLLIAVAACANADWIYDADQKTLTSEEFFNADGVSQGRWVFYGVTCDANNGLTIAVTNLTNHEGPSSPQTLDFSLPIKSIDGKTSYHITQFTGITNYNLFYISFDTTKGSANKSGSASNSVKEIILPSTCSYSFVNALWGGFYNCVRYEFKGDYAEIGSRQLCNCPILKEIQFHFMPPKVYNNSYTLSIDISSLQARIMYPSYLKTAWSNVVHDSNYGIYNISLTSSDIETYDDNDFGSNATLPTGIAQLNNYSSAKRKFFLVPYDEPTYENKIRIGIMGEPWDLFWAIKDTNNLKDDSLTRYGYGVHEFDISNGGSVTIRSPKRYMTYNGTRKICVGYKLHCNPDVIVPYQETYTFDTAGNYGITWVWADNIPGFRISIR
jgi:hypothetical protein